LDSPFFISGKGDNFYGKVNCTRLTASAQISTKACYLLWLKAPIKASAKIDVYNDGADSATAAKHVVPQYDNGTVAVDDIIPNGIRCGNGLYVKLATADEAYVYWN
jgi:hypothetical protein